MRQLLLRVENVNRPQIVRLEIVRQPQRAANRLRDLVVIKPFIVQPDAAQVMRVLQRIHDAEREIDLAIDVIVAFLHAG